MMENTEYDESSLCRENEPTQSLREVGTTTQTFEGTGRKQYFVIYLSIPKPSGTLMRNYCSCLQKTLQWRPLSVMRGISWVKVLSQETLLHPVRIREWWMKKSLPSKNNFSTCWTKQMSFKHSFCGGTAIPRKRRFQFCLLHVSWLIML